MEAGAFSINQAYPAKGIKHQTIYKEAVFSYVFVMNLRRRLRPAHVRLYDHEKLGICHKESERSLIFPGALCIGRADRPGKESVDCTALNSFTTNSISAGSKQACDDIFPGLNPYIDAFCFKQPQGIVVI